MYLRQSLPLLLAALSLPFCVSAQTYDDIAATRYATAFQYLSQRGAVNGYRDGTVRPNAPLNRAEALKAILLMHANHAERVQWFAGHLPSIPLFWDMDQSAWYAPYVEAGFEQGLVTGYRDRSLKPGNPLAAEEAIALLLRAYGVNPSNGTDDAWYAPAVTQAFDKNLIASGEQLYLGGAITRGQFFDMLYRLDVVQRDNLVAFVDASTPQAPVVVQQPVQPVAAPVVEQPAPVVVSIPDPAPAEQAFTISIPALGIDGLVVGHPTDPTSSKGLLAPLVSGVGHLFSYPGGNGKIMIYGHSSGYPWDVSKFTKIFRKVNELNTGDQVSIAYRGKEYRYQVAFKEEVPADDMKPFSGEGEELILYTCWPPDSIKLRYLVHAYPVNDMAAR